MTQLSGAAQWRADHLSRALEYRRIIDILMPWADGGSSEEEELITAIEALADAESYALMKFRMTRGR